jgi:hypothetical protein
MTGEYLKEVYRMKAAAGPTRRPERKIMQSLGPFGKPIARSWPGGPWIETDRPKTDRSVMYVCDVCLLPARTGVRIASGGTNKGKWCCATCEEGGTRQLPSAQGFLSLKPYKAEKEKPTHDRNP